MKLEDITIILSRPSESGNVGAVCRAMKTMGFSSLRIVSPVQPLDDEVIRLRSVHASEVWEQAQFFDSLHEAVQDQSLVVGTTRRMGKKRKDFSITPEELAEDFSRREGKAALVFGNERTGLEDAELNLCHLAAHIPANEAFPSLNLSHAVQVFTYSLHRTLKGKQAGGRWVPVDTERVSSLVALITDSLKSIGFYKQAGRAEQELFFSDLLARSGINLDESRYLERIIRKMARLSQDVENIRKESHT